MYKLSYYFNKNKNASFISAISYSFSGYIIGHGQHFFLLVGAAWIPLIILSYIQLNQNRKTIDILKSAVFVFLMVSGAYQALSIAMFYLVFLLFMYFLISAILEKDVKKTFQIIKVNCLFAAVFLLFSLPLINSTLEIISSVDRFENGVNLAQALSFSQPYKALISFILPFSTLKHNDFFGNVDASMINHYCGIIVIIFFVVSLFRKNSVLEYLILVFGLLILSMSFEFVPVREITFKYMPMMNLFLAAPYIRVFGILSIILISANYIAHFEKNIAIEKNKIITVSSFLLIVLFALIIYSISKSSISDYKKIYHSHSLEELLHNMSFYQNILIQACFQFFIVSSFIAIILFRQKIKYPMMLILVLIVADLTVAAQLNMHKTVIDTKFKPSKMQKDLSLSPEKFPIPINDKIIFNDQQHAFFSPFWRNTYIFSKQISFDAFSSFELNSYSKLDHEFPNLKNAVLNNHLFYFSDTILSLNTFSDNEIDVQKATKYLYLYDQDFEILKNNNVKTDSSDEIQITVFSPNKVIASVKTKHDQFLTMLQTNFNGWEASIDEKLTPIYTSNYNYRTILLPKGNHVITYEYKNNNVLIQYIISNASFFICILFLLGIWLNKRNNKSKTYILIPIALLILLIILIVRCLVTENINQTMSQLHNKRWSKENANFSFKQDFEVEKINYDTITVFSGIKSYKAFPENEFLPIIEITQDMGKFKNSTLVFTTRIFPSSYSKAFIVSVINNEWHASKIEKQIEKLNQWNEIIYCRNISDIKEGEVIKVYLWNPNKSTFKVDDITIDFYK